MLREAMKLLPNVPPSPAVRMAAVCAAAAALAACTSTLGVAAGQMPLQASTAPRPAATPTPAPPVIPTAQPSPTPPDPTTAPLLRPTFTPTVADGEPLVIGTSVAGRPLEVFRFGHGERELLIVAGIHGGYEWNTIGLADLLIERLRDEPSTVPQDVRLYVLRALNPDGEARSHSYEGRANENGVDLNRNWPIDWHPDWNRAYCWDYLPISGGPHPVSEPEVAALMRFILDHDFEAMISYHSAALGIFPGGSPPDPASQGLARAVADVSGYRYPPLNYGCEFTGQFADWGVSQGIASIDVELTTHESLDYEINLKVLEAFLAWRP